MKKTTDTSKRTVKRKTPKRLNLQQIIAKEKKTKKEMVAAITTAMIMGRRLEVLAAPEALTKDRLKRMVKHSRMVAEMIADTCNIDLLV